MFSHFQTLCMKGLSFFNQGFLLNPETLSASRPIELADLCVLWFMIYNILYFGYLRSEDGIVWLCHFLVNLNIYNSPFYHATAQSHYLMMIWRDGSLSTLCYSCRFACQQRVLHYFCLVSAHFSMVSLTKVLFIKKRAYKCAISLSEKFNSHELLSINMKNL